MKLSEVKTILPKLEKVSFVLENGSIVPENFHVTEVGQVTKKFIDCGGTIREEKTVSFQLFNANDFDHRLKPQKLHRIIELSEKQLCIEDAEVEVEYQSDTIGKFGLHFDGENFVLQNKATACLASDQCGIPQEKPKIKFSELAALQKSSCTPNSGCC